ncbi:MAG: hypothetical protein IME94_02405 [Proteobacteria bacterium]|nr:hypothetical protein [Pseudomonadota bacterium]
MGANYGVHKGTLPKIKGRKTLLLQLQYSIRGILSEDYQPIERDAITGNVRSSLDSWVNRLIVRNIKEK